MLLRARKMSSHGWITHSLIIKCSHSLICIPLISGKGKLRINVAESAVQWQYIQLFHWMRKIKKMCIWGLYSLKANSIILSGLWRNLRTLQKKKIKCAWKCVTIWKRLMKRNSLTIFFKKKHCCNFNCFHSDFNLVN